MAEFVSVETLFLAVGFEAEGPVEWNDGSLPDQSGVYVIAVADPASAVLGQPAKGKASDTQIALARQKWFGDQPVVYIGKAKILKKRLKQFYAHRYPERSPHSGGQPILLIRQPLSIWWVVAKSETELPFMEDKLLKAFEERAGRKPFGNRVRAAQSKFEHCGQA